MTADDDDVPPSQMLWRYMELWKFESILEHGALFFTRPINFKDTWEGNHPPSWLPPNPDPEHAQYLAEMVQKRKYAFFVSCWNMGADENAEMWRTYGLAPEGIAIQSTFGLLRRQLYEALSCGKVVYYDETKPKPSGLFGPDLMRYKRECYSWENEFRFWEVDWQVWKEIEKTGGVDESKLPTGKFSTLGQIPDVVQRLVVAPGASDSFIAAVEDVCGKHHKPGLGRRLERSSLKL